MKIYFKCNLAEPVNLRDELYSGSVKEYLTKNPECKWIGFREENTIYWINRKYIMEQDKLNLIQVKEFAVSRETITKEIAEPLDRQIGGDHYKTPIQPVEYIHVNNIGYIEGCVIKYVTRWRKKGGIQDIDKAIHYLELLKQLEQEKEKEVNNANNP